MPGGVPARRRAQKPEMARQAFRCQAFGRVNVWMP
jgi:hypothetical protein